MGYGLRIHPEVLRAHIEAATPPSPRRHKPQRYGAPLTFAILALAALLTLAGAR